jgi:chromosome partitioning protein
VRPAGPQPRLQPLTERLVQVASEAEALSVTALLVDTPPHLDKSALEAIRFADLILCPTKPDLLSLGALADTVALIDHASAKEKTLAVINDLPTAAKARALALETATVALQRLGVRIAEQTIGHSQAIVDAIGVGLGITEKAPRNAASKEIEALWAEIVARTGAVHKEAAK